MSDFTSFQGKGERRTVAANLNCWDVQAA